MTRLTGPELRELRDILRKAYKLSQFDRLMADRLDRSREDYGLGDSYVDILFNVLDDANRLGWVDDLVKQAAEENPSDVELYEFSLTHFGRGVTGGTRDNLEKIVTQSNQFLDILTVLGRLGTIYRQVCRISFADGAKPQGTGFLVGPSTVLTNYHVMEPVIKGSVPASEVRAQFDYATLTNGKIDNGTRVQLAKEWLIDSSPYNQMDVDGQGPAPTLEQLDFAVIRLKRAMGNQAIGEKSTAQSPTRSWIDLSAHAPVPAKDTAIHIVQHPNGETMKLATDTKSVIGANATGSRLRHRTNTQGGSSGSPTFNADFDLVALHNGGDPVSVTAKFNQGVPIAPILELMKQRKTFDALSE